MSKYLDATPNLRAPYRKYFRADNRDRISAWKRGYDPTYNGMENGRGDRYGYDYEGQLTAASYRAENPDDTATTPYRTETFDYDELGNRKEWNDVASRGSMWMARKDNGLNEYSSWQNNQPNPPLHWGGATNYDDDIGTPWGTPSHANGVLMQDGYITAGFNALNQPIAIWAPPYGWGASAQWMWFGFDPLGRCVKRWMGLGTGGAVGSNPATYFYYDGWNLLQEGNETANNVARVYVHGGRVDEMVASWGGGQWRYHHYDARGHCILLTGPTGTLLEQYEYDAFGFPYFLNAHGDRQGAAAYGNRFLFTGREWLGDLRLYDFRNRMYQPELGRFLQPDPKEFGAGDYNLYRYCHNDPVNKSDPFGDIEQKLLEQLKAVLRAIEKAQRRDHADRTQAVKKDGTPGKEIKGTIKSQWDGQRGGFRRDKLKTEVLPEDNDSIAGTGHYHSAPYYKVKGGDGKVHDTALPSQEADVANLKKPMLYGSDPFTRGGKAILLEPRKGKEPSQTIIDMEYDK